MRSRGRSRVRWREADLVGLAEAGNPRLALDLAARVHEPTAPGEVAALRLRLRRARPPTTGILAILTDPGGRREGILCPVAVSDRSPALKAGRTFREAARGAVRKAWQALGGTGEAPPLHVSLGRVETSRFKIVGPSIELPAFLAAAAFLSGERPPRLVVASGGFDQRLHCAEGKLAAFEREATDLGGPALLLAGHVTGRAAGGTARVVREPEDALRMVFGRTPWLRAEIAPPGTGPYRLHIHCGSDRGEPPGPTGDWDRLELPARLEPEALPGIIEDVRGRLAGRRRAEISLAGPTCLAAAMGHALKNASASVRYVHKDGTVWWHNGVRNPRVVRKRASGRPTKRLIIAVTDTGRPPQGWETLDAASPLVPNDLPGLVQTILGRIRGTPDPVDLAIAGPLGLAVALGHSLRQVARIRYHQWNPGRCAYEMWFDSGARGWHP